MMDHKDIFSQKEKLLSISTKAGELLTEYQSKLRNLTVETKEGQGVVSEADKETEKLIISELKKYFPSFNYFAEESSFEKGDSVTPKMLKGYLWLIDPLDGTSNFLSGFDYFSVSVSLCFDGQPIWGSVYRPSSGEMFYAEKGKGAFYRSSSIANEIKMPKYALNERLKDSLLATGFCVEKGIKFDQEFSLFKKVMEHSRGVRRLGSAALDLSYTALGMWDGFWERGLAPWDVGAGAIICQEAGMTVSDYEGQEFTPFQDSIIACAPRLHSDLIKLTKLRN